MMTDQDMIEINEISGYWSFLLSIDWRDPWLIGLIVLHILTTTTTLMTRNNTNFQIFLFLILLSAVYFSESINEYAALNWRSFSKQQYFDSNGLFISTVFSIPILLNCMLLVGAWLYNSTKIMATLKTAQLRDKMRRERLNRQAEVHLKESENALKLFDDSNVSVYNQHSLVEDDTTNFDDEDTCTPEELDKRFQHKYRIHDEPTVTCDSNYVLSLTKDDSFTCIAAGLSDGSVRVLEINSENGVHITPPEKSKHLSICGVRFMDESPNLLLVGTTNGLVRLLDLRTRNEVTRFVNVPSNNLEPRDILSFDRNSNSRLLAMGTAQRRENVNLLFYDLRVSSKLYEYTECHQDDLTSLCFHPRNPDLLCSGSTDGLINILNVKANDEDDAILTTINTYSTVHKVNWHKNKLGKDIVSCITHTNDFKTYTFDGDIIADFDRLKITETIKRSNELNCSLISCHNMADNSMMLLTGSNFNGSVLRSCKVQGDQLSPYAIFEGNEQIVRESAFDSKTNILITAGESGVVTLWTPLAWDSNTPSTSSSSPCTSLKMKTKKSNKVTPY